MKYLKWNAKLCIYVYTCVCVFMHALVYIYICVCEERAWERIRISEVALLNHKKKKPETQK